MFIRTLLTICLLLMPVAGSASNESPLYLLIQATDDVNYSVSGEKWRPVVRNKFLYTGYHIKTGHNGTCKLIDQETGKILKVPEKTEIKIDDAGAMPLKGKITPADASGGFFSFLQRKFAKVQKYTVVKRSGSASRNRLSTASYITLSDEYPDLVWESWGEDYTYRLVLDGRDYDVDSVGTPMVRYTLPKMKPGEYPYHINVLYQEELIYASDRKGMIKWLSENEKRTLDEKKEKIRTIDPDNGFLLGNILDENGFKVAAMDQYRQFLSDNPDINEVRPFLIKVYSDLKLKHLKEAEAIRYLEVRSDPATE